jgi:hypothetical protein
MGNIDKLEKQCRIVSEGTHYVLHHVAMTPHGRAILLDAASLSLETGTIDEMWNLLASLGQAADLPVLQQADLIAPEFYEGARFVVQRHYFNDYPTYTDFQGEDGLPLGFGTKEEAHAYIEKMLDSEYEAQQKQYEVDKAREDKIKEKFQARKAVLEEHGLWSEDALETQSWRAPRPAVRGKGDNYCVVLLEESTWAREY